MKGSLENKKKKKPSSMTSLSKPSFGIFHFKSVYIYTNASLLYLISYSTVKYCLFYFIGLHWDFLVNIDYILAINMLSWKKLCIRYIMSTWKMKPFLLPKRSIFMSETEWKARIFVSAWFRKHFYLKLLINEWPNKHVIRISSICMT